MPVEYITRHCEFRGLDFLVDKHVLIPRVEEEDFIRLALKYVIRIPLSPSPYPLALADLGTGSGVLGITLYKELTTLGLLPTVYLSDISDKALVVVRKNVVHLLHKDRPVQDGPFKAHILKSHLFNNYPSSLVFDLVVANLPYIPSDRISKLPVSVRNFEPHIALDGGSDGLRLINKCIHQISTRLKPHGIAILEIDEAHTITDFQEISHFDLKIQKDQSDKNRFLVLSLR